MEAEHMLADQYEGERALQKVEIYPGRRTAIDSRNVISCLDQAQVGQNVYC